MEAEFAPWRKLRRFSRLTRPTGHASRVEWFQAKIGDLYLDVYLTGILRKKPEQHWCFQDGPDICISSGLAGALAPSFESGAVVVASEVVSREGQNCETSDERLAELAERRGARRAKRFLNSGCILQTREAKTGAAQLGEVVEMESLSILRDARLKDIPAVAIRAISDTHDEELPLDFNRATSGRGEIDLANMLWQMTLKPRQIPKLIEFGQRSKQAAVRLAEFLDGYVSEVSSAFAQETTRRKALARG